MDLGIHGRIVLTYFHKIITVYGTPTNPASGESVFKNKDDKKIFYIFDLFNDRILLRFTSTENIPREENERNDI
jgi:hypothetical protein